MYVTYGDTTNLNGEKIRLSSTNSINYSNFSIKPNNMKKIILVLMLVAGSFFPTLAQQAILSAGGDASGSGGTASYSIGQSLYITNSGEAGSISQGVQQSYIIEAITGLDDLGISLNLTAYPNPTTDFIQLEIGSEMLTDISYHLYNMQGKLIVSKQLTEVQTGIDMTSLSSDTYILKVIQKNADIKTFKIIKN